MLLKSKHFAPDAKVGELETLGDMFRSHNSLAQSREVDGFMALRRTL